MTSKWRQFHLTNRLSYNSSYNQFVDIDGDAGAGEVFKSTAIVSEPTPIDW
jgi:hypothetical protein